MSIKKCWIRLSQKTIDFFQDLSKFRQEGYFQKKTGDHFGGKIYYSLAETGHRSVQAAGGQPDLWYL